MVSSVILAGNKTVCYDPNYSGRNPRNAAILDVLAAGMTSPPQDTKSVIWRNLHHAYKGIPTDHPFPIALSSARQNRLPLWRAGLKNTFVDPSGCVGWYHISETIIPRSR